MLNQPAEKDERYYHAYLSHHSISRRGLFRGVLGSAEKTFSVKSVRSVPRPPFAAKEELFLTACTGCGDCVKACELGLIQLENQKAILDLSYASCTLCGKCAEHCSTNALHLAFNADTELRPQFNSNCLYHRQQPCTDCQQACPQQAISANLSVDNERCNGCGECQLACFMSAIQLNLTPLAA
ncbi:ferredoxin-type protein NapF [Pasteurellaceae bacterium Pebbles2]|nr:ferredoxin-type protein NapF [Pasteurellaceae bacterium Pebbles2]